MVIARVHRGVYAPGEDGVDVMPKYYKGDGSKTGVLLLHGYQDTPISAFLNEMGNNQTTLAKAIADAGFPCFSPLAGGASFANDTALARVTDAKNYLQSVLGAKPGKIALLGLSMGGGTAMAWARANPNLVSCLILLEPMSDINDLVTNNRWNLTAPINAAYGGAYNNVVHGPTHNPESFKTELRGLKAHVWYATDDTAVLPSTVQSIIAAADWSDVHTVPGDHGASMYNQVDVPTVVNYLKANA